MNGEDEGLWSLERQAWRATCLALAALAGVRIPEDVDLAALLREAWGAAKRGLDTETAAISVGMLVLDELGDERFVSALERFRLDRLH